MVYKRLPILQAGGTRLFPASPHELLELSPHRTVTSVHLQYQTAGRMAITSEEGSKLG
jgi:hypothetical protein